ncbi:MAG: hypothetical protein FWG56_08835 [Desulfovibrionaceae bacterium]|jgi:hypothetical protein|nr:hypothetical protein [Desulfovibrionaceae bacterium]
MTDQIRFNVNPSRRRFAISASGAAGDAARGASSRLAAPRTPRAGA